MGHLEGLYNTANLYEYCGHNHSNHIHKSINTIQSETEILDEYEDELHKSLLAVFDDYKKEFYQKFEDIFLPVYLANKSLLDYLGVYIHGNDNVREYVSKGSGGIDEAIRTVTALYSGPLESAMQSKVISSFKMGGKSALKLMDIDVDFKIVNTTAIDAIKKSQSEISSKVTKEINDLLKGAIIEGVELGESAEQVAARIKLIWDNPVPINVPPLLDEEGNIIRAGYTRYITADTWALMVARTEIIKAFQAGRLQAYKDSGVVTEVRYEVGPDERVCAICMSLDGLIYILEQAGDIIPQHPNCRCVFIPIFDKGKFNIAVNNLETLYSN